MNRIKALFGLLVGTALLAGIFVQVRVGGNAKVEGSAVLDPSPSGPSSVGPAGAIQASDGAGGFQNTGCSNNGTEFYCPTFTASRSFTVGGKTCHWLPDQHYINIDKTSYPLDPFSDAWVALKANSTVAVTGASWAAGTATMTFASTASISNGGAYFIQQVKSSGCTGGGDCGYNGATTTLFGAGTFVVVTVVNGTTITYSLASNPGTYTSGGILYLTHIRLQPIPSMYINYGTNSTATPATTQDLGSYVTDSGPFPILSTYQEEGLTLGGTQFLSAAPNGSDGHVFVVNMDTCDEYEGFLIQNNSAPWHFGNMAIWSLNSLNLRTARKINPASTGLYTPGLTSADVAGLIIEPFVLTYAEYAAAQPINHMLRYTLAGSGLYNGYVWPATDGNCCNAAIPPLGIMTRLKASFDTTTCHWNDGAGVAYPAAFHNLLVTLQKFGMMFADGGVDIGFTSDADQAWLVGGFPSAPNSQLAGWSHCLQMSDFEIIDPGIHVVGVTSAALR